MTYAIREQSHSWLVLEQDPESGNRAQAERLLAVCGNRADAVRVVMGLQILDARQEETQP